MIIACVAALNRYNDSITSNVMIAHSVGVWQKPLPKKPVHDMVFDFLETDPLPADHQHTVTETDIGIRLDKWLTGEVSRDIIGMSRSRVQGFIEQGYVTRNGQVFTDISYKVREGECYEVSMPETRPAPIQAEARALDVVFEDDHLIVINKPAGLVVHPGAGNQDGTLVNALIAHCGDSLSGIGGVARPGIVHRIDKETSGLLVIAKHDEAHVGLADLFAVHNIDRVYEAFIIGALRPGLGTIETKIGRASHDRKKMTVLPDEDERPGTRHAITHYKTIERFGVGRAKLSGDALASHIECTLETGRTHQIRVHMTHLGAPLIGDPVYGRGPGLTGLKPTDAPAENLLRFLKQFRRQALHARHLGFRHPITSESLAFDAPLPADMKTLQNHLTALTAA